MNNFFKNFFDSFNFKKQDKEIKRVNEEQPMYKFGKKSYERLLTCDPRLQEILNEAIKIVDFSVLCGHRGEEDQNKAYNEGKSKLKWPDSKHNSYPSMAADIAPYPIDWMDEVRFAHLIGIVRGIAAMKGYTLRVGIDWDRDGEIRDHKFLDFPHIEILD